MLRPNDLTFLLSIERLRAGDGERLRSIRLRSLQDAPDAFATTLDEAAAWDLETWNRQLEERATFVATVGDSDVGLVRGALLDQVRDTVYLLSMWVAPEARHQGVGSALVEAVVEWARAQGSMRVVLDVGAANSPAIALYTRMGFVPTGEVGTLPPPRDHVRQIHLMMSL